MLEGRAQPERSMTVSAWGSLVVVSVLLLAAIGWFAVSRGMRGEDPDMRQLMARLGVVDKKGETSVRAFGESQGGVASAVPAGAASGAPPGDTLDRLETEFSREPEDSLSSEVEGRLREAVKDKRLLASGIVPEGVDVKCRHDMCRVVADFRNDGDAADWTALYTTFLEADAASSRRIVFVKNADGGTQARIFAIRRQQTGR